MSSVIWEHDCAPDIADLELRDFAETSRKCLVATGGSSGRQKSQAPSRSIHELTRELRNHEFEMQVRSLLERMKLTAVPDQLADLRDRVQILERQTKQRSIIVPIQDLGPTPVEVTNPILVVAYEEDGVFIASFIDANMNASGETQLDAIEMLKDVIASSFRLFLDKEAILGTEPRRQLAVLKRFLRMR